ncbi:ComF family protein [Lactobacillus hominis]|uniref:ComF family protein n=1 Tax=Lactobacillus hominis TaxID=1203033 RepID=UPI00058CEE5B|nr:double zinc ribbon domain-containing protein [Lactobacillus hominis]MCT3348519.1 ComF family protein [Lactobacillus hominis]
MNRCLLCNSLFKVQLNYSNLFFSLKNDKIVLCQSCFSKFKKITGKTCQNCNKRLSENFKLDICQDCQRWQQLYPDNLLKNKALYRYNDAFHDLMVNYKRYGDFLLHEVLSYLVKKLPKADFYVPVPSSPSHLEKRKFDTISEIYKDLVPLTFALTKDNSQQAQGEKNKQQRLATKQTFKSVKKYKLSGRILLLDDIYTTGRTLYHARDALQQAYPKIEIMSFTIAR